MYSEDIIGILDLDAVATEFSESDPSRAMGMMLFRHVVYNYHKLKNGFSFVAEIHQRGPMGVVEVVVLNSPEAKQMVLMTNKQIAVFMVYYLNDQGSKQLPFAALQAKHCALSCAMK